MPIARIANAGQLGVVKDLSAQELGNNAWSDARNVRFQNGRALQSLGHGEIYTGAPVVPYHVMSVYVGPDRYWLYAGLTKVYAVAGATGSIVHTNLTRQTLGVDVNYSGIANRWTSTSLSGIPVLNNGVDPPQRWNLNLSNRCVDLDNWPANMTAKAVRAYKNQLVALNVTKSGTNYPYMVKWSTPADPGAVPSTWDETDATHDAGEVDLAEGGDPVMDGMQLGGTFVVYKERSVWRMDYTGGTFVEQFTKVLGTSGAMNLNCIAEIDGFHVVLTNDDVIVHDGQSAQSVLDNQARRYLFQSIDAQNADRCFVFKNPFLNEVWVCYPEGGYTAPNVAMVWNYKEKTVSFRDVPNLNHANFGPVESGVSQPWDADSAPWNSDVSGWSTSEFTPDSSRVLMASEDQKLFLLDSSTTFDGALPSVRLERRGLKLWPPESRGLITAVRPRVLGANGETITVEVGGANDQYSDPTYGDPLTYTIGQDDPAIYCTTDARYPAIRFSGGSAYQFAIDAYDIEFQPSGRY